ncbi:MAG: nitronate monooxygenase [Vicinamibacteria bacterium]
MKSWRTTRLVERLGLTHPIVQGPFGGGLSSAALAAAVSNLGGLGSYGAQGHAPERIREVAAAIRQLTARPFAINLWVSTEDEGARAVTEARFLASLVPLLPLYRELAVEPPAYAPLPEAPFERQAEALVAARVPAFSFVFGVPDAAILADCRAHGIVTLGTATTVAEAVALDEAGVDVVVASGLEAGGHRASFLASAEESLTGLLALVPQVVDAVRAPVVAAGGIADGRGVAAALVLGAEGVQVGTAFLACEESNAAPAHKEALLGARAGDTLLTRGFSGRLARGLRNRLAEHLAREGPAPLPYPVQGDLLSPLRRAALAQDRADLVSLWAGQAAPLARHRRARDVFEALVSGTDAILGAS